jgi:hypothetical protein
VEVHIIVPLLADRNVLVAKLCFLSYPSVHVAPAHPQTGIRIAVLCPALPYRFRAQAAAGLRVAVQQIGAHHHFFVAAKASTAPERVFIGAVCAGNDG